MALLQISEPGQSPAPHQRRIAIGIDLGTTNSLVATVRSGEAVTLADDQGRVTLPSAVRYHSDSAPVVGYSAYDEAPLYPQDSLLSVKRFMGRALSDIDTSHYPYQFAEQDGVLYLQTRAGLKNPVQVSADILTTLAQRAQSALGAEADGVVITVPAYFDDAQRQATKDAAQLAGLSVLRLLNEPTAAAVAYGLDSGQEGVIAVYDLGGGTFDISILRLSKGVFEVLATGGDAALGGDDFDRALLEWIKQQLGLPQQLPPGVYRQLHQFSTAAKVALSDKDAVELQFDVDGELKTLRISREQFESLIQPLVKRTLMACRRALRDAQVSTDEVLEVVMVGGSTRVPLVRQQVGEFFARPPLTSIDPDQVVAIGAAIQADVLVGNKPDSEMLLLDVLPLSLGIETMGGLVEKIIPRNTTIPVARAQEFTTYKDGQTAMAIHVVQGERELVADCRSLARFDLTGIPPMAAGAAHIRVTFQVDADGLLSVTALEKSSGVQAQIQVKPAYGLSDDQVAQMLKDSMRYAEQDMNARMLAEQRVEAQRALESVQAALNADGERLLSAQEYAQITAAMSLLSQISQGDDHLAIKAQIEQLDSLTAEFAERRMDDSIRRVLTGQQVDKV